MSVSKRLMNEAALLRVLGSGNETQKTLQHQSCQRCGKTWWPRQSTKPARCPRCKRPYWDKQRRIKGAIAPLKEGVSKKAIARAVAEGLKKAFRTDERGEETGDCFCTWLVKREALQANPVAGMDRPPHRIEAPKQVPTPSLMDALIEAARKRQRPRDVAIFLIMRFTGMRRASGQHSKPGTWMGFGGYDGCE